MPVPVSLPAPAAPQSASVKYEPTSALPVFSDKLVDLAWPMPAKWTDQFRPDPTHYKHTTSAYLMVRVETNNLSLNLLCERPLHRCCSCSCSCTRLRSTECCRRQLRYVDVHCSFSFAAQDATSDGYRKMLVRRFRQDQLQNDAYPPEAFSHKLRR